ncbi:MAG: hypothetical protein INR62_00875 [Rhodospirillales bacterium]|nr:hypothetical protein [Acetobacter sp.]
MPANIPVPFRHRPRRYLQIDAPLSRLRAELLATNPLAVSRHAFLPFILAEVTTQKIQRRVGGGIVRKPPKVRPIAYAAHADAHIFAHYSDFYISLYERAVHERGLHRVVTAFRRLRGWCNIDFADEAFETIRRMGRCYVIASDIRDFFNQLVHRRLKEALKTLLGVDELPADDYAVYKAITRYCTVDRAELFRALNLNPHRPRPALRYRLCSAEIFREQVRGGGLCHPNKSGRGIPQGSPISAVLANLYMLEFDTAINALVTSHGGLYRRYCDDLLVVLPTAELRDQMLALIRSGLQNLGLEAQEAKTELIDFVQRDRRLTNSHPLNYLGFTFDGAHKRIRPASVARYYRKMRSGVRRANATRSRVNKLEGNRPWTPLKHRQLYIRYSYLGRHNFISYALRAARIMHDPGIKRQVQPHWRKLQSLITPLQ